MGAHADRIQHMKLSVKSEYACLALIDLAERYDEGYARITDIAERQSIPKKFLEQILLALNRARYVQCKRGSGGGYMLSKPPGQISIAEILRLVDGPLAPVGSASKYFYEETPVKKHKVLLAIFRDIRDYAANKLQETTLADLVGQ